MQLTGAEIVVRALQDEGVTHVFGYPGGAVLYIYDEIFKQDKFQHILVRHEQAAVHAADAYSRSSQRVGVALVTSGPGVTNAVTGIATAYMDSIPMVIVTGQVPTHAIGQDAFQECDTVGITRPCVKHNFLVKDVRELAATMKKAFYIAQTGRPGPVLVDVPKDVTIARAEYEYPRDIEMRSYKPVLKGHQGQIKKAVQLLLAAERPMIYTGGGVILSRLAPTCVNRLVNLLGFPCTNTLMGLGGFKASDRKFVGMLGMHGTYEANMAMQHCDVLLAVGARFDDRVIGNPKHFATNPRKIIHIDVDPSSISKRVKVDVPIVGDVREVLIELLAQIEAAQRRARRRGAEGLVDADRGVAQARLPALRAERRGRSSRSTSSRSCGRSPRATPSSRPTSASTRCGRRSTTASTSRAAGSIPAASARWASACRTRWACRWPIPARRSRASPARRRSRCASRNCRPASSTA